MQLTGGPGNKKITSTHLCALSSNNQFLLVAHESGVQVTIRFFSPTLHLFNDISQVYDIQNDDIYYIIYFPVHKTQTQGAFDCNAHYAVASSVYCHCTLVENGWGRETKKNLINTSPISFSI